MAKPEQKEPQAGKEALKQNGGEGQATEQKEIARIKRLILGDGRGGSSLAMKMLEGDWLPKAIIRNTNEFNRDSKCEEIRQAFLKMQQMVDYSGFMALKSNLLSGGMQDFFVKFTPEFLEIWAEAKESRIGIFQLLSNSVIYGEFKKDRKASAEKIMNIVAGLKGSPDFMAAAFFAVSKSDTFARWLMEDNENAVMAFSGLQKAGGMSKEILNAFRYNPGLDSLYVKHWKDLNWLADFSGGGVIAVNAFAFCAKYCENREEINQLTINLMVLFSGVGKSKKEAIMDHVVHNSRYGQISDFREFLAFLKEEVARMKNIGIEEIERLPAMADSSDSLGRQGTR